MGFMASAGNLAKQWGAESPIGKNLGAGSSIGSSLRKAPGAIQPIATLPSWMPQGPQSLMKAPSWMPDFGQQQGGGDGSGFVQMMARLFGPRRG